MTHGPGMASATKVGPAAQLPVCMAAVVAVGMETTGPKPHVTVLPLDGVR